MICGCINFWRNSDFVWNRILIPWAICASRDECLLPSGAGGFEGRGRCQAGYKGKCHRGDQSALSIILFEIFGSESSLVWKKQESTSSQGIPPPYMLNISKSYVDHHRRQHWKALNVTTGDPPYKDVADFFFQAEQKKVQSTAIDFSQLSLELSTSR